MVFFINLIYYNFTASYLLSRNGVLIEIIRRLLEFLKSIYEGNSHMIEKEPVHTSFIINC